MCGIAGYAAIGPAPGNDQFGCEMRVRLEKAIEALGHRGPDGRGYFQDDRTGVGHARLSIVDLSDAGRQPFVRKGASDSGSGDGAIVAAVNGEIYNYKELRRDLEAMGRSFSSGCDSEVLPVGYEAKGLGVLREMDGMYAAALYDAGRDTLLLARDRRGKKPLFYALADGLVCFSSEIKGLFPLLGGRPEVDYAAMGVFLKLGYVPAPKTMYMGVRKVRPGECVEFHLGAGETAFHAMHCGADVAVDPLRPVSSVLTHAVGRRLMGDTPVAAFLSGGVDSGLIAAMCAREFEYRLTCFTLRSERGDSGEADLAGQVAGRYGHSLVEVAVPQGRDLLETYRGLCGQWDQPDTNLANVSMSLLSAAAHQSGFKVALTGDGADELFYGYDRYRRLALRRPWSAFGRGFGLREYLASRPGFLAGFVRPGPWTEGSVLDLVNEMDYVVGVKPNNIRLRNEAVIDNELWVPEQANMRSDYNSMVHSLEVRCPFQDIGLKAVAEALPVPFKSKAPLRKLAAPLLPPEVFARKKTGFSTILEHEMSLGLDAWAECVSAENVKKVGLFDIGKIERMLGLGKLAGKPIPGRLRMVLLAQMWFMESKMSF